MTNGIESPVPFSDLGGEIPQPPARRGAGALLRTAARIAFFRRVSDTELAPTWMEIAAAAFLTICVPTIAAILGLGDEGRWGFYLLPQVFFHVVVALAAAIVIAAILRRPHDVPLLLFAMLLARVVIDALTLGLWNAAESLLTRPPLAVGLLFYYLPLVWLALAAARFAISLGPLSMPRRGWVVIAALVLLALPQANLHIERSLWVKDWAREAGGATNNNASTGPSSEEAFYRQPELLARELAAVEPQRPGVIDVFFVGVAGYGNQDVFLREVDSVARLMSERFGAAGHIVKLVNNRKSALVAPIASVTSLRAALRRTAQQMDPEEDVLVLFLTSHGSADHKFSLELWPLRLNDMDPGVLRAALDDAGIRNRVIVISACYSGGFIDKLKDDRTLVITAAARDKTSFGCSDENDWTYFGKAYFDEALRSTFSFTKAFEIARPVIATREKAQEFEPSDPQISAGDGIRAKLVALEAQLSAPPPESPRREAASPVAAGADLFSRYVSLTWSPSFADEVKTMCLENMRLTSPDKWLEKDPATFGGLDRTSRLWPRLVLAWEEYSLRFCNGANDPALMLRLYDSEVRSAMTEKDLAPIIQFLSTEAGRRWFEKEREVNRQQMKKLAGIQNELSKSGYARYIEEQSRINAEFRKDKEKAAPR